MKKYGLICHRPSNFFLRFKESHQGRAGQGRGVSSFWTLWCELNQLDMAGKGRSDLGKGIRPYKSISVVVNFTISRKHIDRRLDETKAFTRES